MVPSTLRDEGGQGGRDHACLRPSRRMRVAVGLDGLGWLCVDDDLADGSADDATGEVSATEHHLEGRDQALRGVRPAEHDEVQLAVGWIYGPAWPDPSRDEVARVHDEREV